ncbi:hypothetical protein ADZ36_31790 [Streptomyces fradiae]|uniref:Uncharacterized protein n=1 Tax=Streptomyces fradiae TaxID=1906 RepID=A0ACC4W254_STRFR|nr:hypothetical protein ADZ36_31790 [Streptomyces fradiae]
MRHGAGGHDQSAGGQDDRVGAEPVGLQGQVEQRRDADGPEPAQEDGATPGEPERSLQGQQDRQPAQQQHTEDQQDGAPPAQLAPLAPGDHGAQHREQR